MFHDFMSFVSSIAAVSCIVFPCCRLVAVASNLLGRASRCRASVYEFCVHRFWVYGFWLRVPEFNSIHRFTGNIFLDAVLVTEAHQDFVRQWKGYHPVNKDHVLAKSEASAVLCLFPQTTSAEAL